MLVGQADVLKHRQVDLQRKDQLISELEAELLARQQGMEVTNRNHRQLMVRALLPATKFVAIDLCYQAAD